MEAWGDHERQLEVYKKALLIWEEILSPDDLNLATVYSNIGSAYWSLRNNSKSLEYNFKALEIREKMLPSEHLDLATTYNNLATTYHYMRDNKNALMYYQKSLPILETLLSAQHEKLGMAYSNIGDAYREVRQFKESLKYLQQAIYTQEKSLPPEHPNSKPICFFVSGKNCPTFIPPNRSKTTNHEPFPPPFIAHRSSFTIIHFHPSHAKASHLCPFGHSRCCWPLSPHS
jgi:tetratricopeptide (TPR) repeat protein